MSELIARRSVTNRRPAPAGVLLAAVFLGLLLLAAIAPWLLTGQDPLHARVANALAAPSLEHPFGTDQSGRDVFARVVYGVRYSLAIGFGATLLALIAGGIIGTLSGLAPRVVDGVLSRVIDVLMAFPEILLALVVIAVIGPGEASLLTAVALAAVPAYARVARVRTLVVRRASYIRAATALGVPPAVTVMRHIVPNTLAPLLVMATMGVGTAIVSAAGLSFLGMGPQPPTPEWGLILSEGRNFLATAWWIAVFPGLMITLTVISTSVLGRYLQGRDLQGRSAS